MLIILILIIIEITIYVLAHYLRIEFQWLITTKDDLPNFENKTLTDFLENKHSPELGWVMKPNIKGKESTGSLGALSGHGVTVEYHINHKGARLNPGNEDKFSMISSYGDSYAFCRQVFDNETWPWYLSELTKSNVQNFGVGNYGIDQALLRLKMEYDKNQTPIVILETVPETINRILSVWKHYYEFGNIFAFKPIYKYTNNKLELVENPLNSKDKFYSLPEYLKLIRTNDYFYKTKFNKYKLRFPYTYFYFRHPIRNVSLFISLLLRPLLRLFKFNFDAPWEIILKSNSNYCKKLYKKEYPVQLLLEIIKEFVAFSKLKKFKAILLILPFEKDLEYFKKNKKKYYSHFVDEASKIVETIDLTEKLSFHDTPLYTNKFYGSHINKYGNELVANYLYAKIKHSTELNK